jgi:hypothetical protein
MNIKVDVNVISFLFRGFLNLPDQPFLLTDAASLVIFRCMHSFLLCIRLRVSQIFACLMVAFGWNGYGGLSMVAFRKEQVTPIWNVSLSRYQWHGTDTLECCAPITKHLQNFLSF